MMPVPGGVVKKVVRGEAKLLFMTMVLGAVIGAVIWEHHGEAIKAWVGEHVSCPMHDNKAPATE